MQQDRLSTLPLKIIISITKHIKLQVVRSINKCLFLANQPRFDEYINPKNIVTPKHIQYLIDNYPNTFIIYEKDTNYNNVVNYQSRATMIFNRQFQDMFEIIESYKKCNEIAYTISRYANKYYIMSYRDYFDHWHENDKIKHIDMKSYGFDLLSMFYIFELLGMDKTNKGFSKTKVINYLTAIHDAMKICNKYFDIIHYHMWFTTNSMILGLMSYDYFPLNTLIINDKNDINNWNAFEQYPNIVKEKNRIKCECTNMYNSIMPKMRSLRMTPNEALWVTVTNPCAKIDMNKDNAYAMAKQRRIYEMSSSDSDD